MIRRPNADEDDEELLRQQEEFFRKTAENKVEPAAIVVSEKKVSVTPSNRDGIENTSIDIQEQIANTFEAIPKDMKLGTVIELNRPKTCSRLKFDNSRGFPKASRRDPDINPSKGSIFSQHIKRLKKEVIPAPTIQSAMEEEYFISIVKEKSTQDITKSYIPAKKAQLSSIVSTTLSSTDSKQIHKENTKTLNSLSEAEILAEREKLIATLDPAIVAFLRSEKRKREREQWEQTRNLTIQEQNEAADDIHIDELVTPSEVLSKPESENWLNFNQIETNKLAWMKNIDIPKEVKDRCFEARFDFEGYLLPFAVENITEENRILYHHGDEAGRPGYSLQEILQLSRSNVIQQKIVALNTLANILALNSTGIYDEIIDIPIEQIFFVLRFCLDDNTPAVLNAAVKALRNLIYFQLDETCLDNLLSFGLGLAQPILAIDYSLEDDNTINDQQLVESNLIKCLARTNILIRLRYIINTVKPPLETIVYCIEILIRLARDSEYLINRIFECEGLLSSLVSHLVPHPSSMKSDNNYSEYNTPLVQAVKFFRILCSRDLKIAQKVLKLFNLSQVILEYLYDDTFSQNANGLKLQVECLHFLSLLVHYDLSTDFIRSSEDLLQRFLNYHFRNTNNLDTTTLVRQSHVAALLTLVSQILRKGHVISSTLTQLLELCVEKWMKQFNNFGTFACGKSQIISSVLMCCASILKQKQNEKIEVLLIEIMEFTTFREASKHITNASVLLNNYETHKSSSNIKSLESSAWYTMEHIIPLLQSNSCLPLVYALSCSVLASKSEKIKEVFLDHISIKNYMKSLQTSQTLFHAGNWFTRCESFTIMNILKVAKSIETRINPSIYYDIAVKCLCVFSSEQKPDIDYLLENVIFCKQFYPIEVIFENSRINVEWNTELGNAWESLEEIRKVYVSVLGLKNNLVNFEVSASIDMSLGNVIPVDWIYTPIIILYSNHQDNKNTMKESEQLETIKNCLRWILIYETHFPTLASSLSSTEKYCRLACLFLASDNLFLIDEIQNSLQRNFEILMKFENEFNFKKEIAGLTNFQDFYTQLLEQYQAVSYGNKLFGNVILVPLAQRHNVQLRKTLWSEYRGVLQVFNLTASEIWCSLESFKNPPEEDVSLLQSYRVALATNYVQKSSVLYEIARHHLEKYGEKMALKKVSTESCKMDET